MVLEYYVDDDEDVMNDIRQRVSYARIKIERLECCVLCSVYYTCSWYIDTEDLASPRRSERRIA